MAGTIERLAVVFMRLLFLNQYFWPDIAATSQLLTDLAEDLARCGWEVTVFAGRGGYSQRGERNPGARKLADGIDVKRVWCTSFGRSSTLGRVSDYLTFFASAMLAVLFGRALKRGENEPPPVVVCLSTPPLVAVIGALVRRRARFVYKVEDLYPEVAVALGALRPRSPLTRMLRSISRWTLRRAERVVALDNAMASNLAAAGAGRIETIPNWADGELIKPDQKAGEAMRRKLEIEDRFVILYSGNLGRAYRFDAVVEAARALAAAESEALFLFVGEGSRLAEVKAASFGLANVRFLPYQPRERLNALYNAADLHLVTLRDEVAGLLVPSKYPAALAAGRPVLLICGAGADLYNEIPTEEVGWALPHRPERVVSALLEAMSFQELRETRGRNARELFERKYSRSLASKSWHKMLLDLASSESVRG